MSRSVSHSLCSQLVGQSFSPSKTVSQWDSQSASQIVSYLDESTELVRSQLDSQSATHPASK